MHHTSKAHTPGVLHGEAGPGPEWVASTTAPALLALLRDQPRTTSSSSPTPACEHNGVRADEESGDGDKRMAGERCAVVIRHHLQRLQAAPARPSLPSLLRSTHLLKPASVRTDMSKVAQGFRVEPLWDTAQPKAPITPARGDQKRARAPNLAHASPAPLHAAKRAIKQLTFGCLESSHFRSPGPVDGRPRKSSSGRGLPK